MTGTYFTVREINRIVCNIRFRFESDELEPIETGVRTSGDDHLGSVIDELADPEFYADVRSRPQMVTL